jgi:hydroxymethylbilane synthase
MLKTIKEVKTKKIRLGTRGSPLALRQADMVRVALAQSWPDIETEIIIIKTSGDWDPAQGETRLLESAGGKGQFAKEIEQALLAGDIDAGVHSMKDMETRLPDGLVIHHMLPREDVRDCFVFKNLADNVQNINDLPHGFRIGTCSVRRQAFLLNLRPDLVISALRGNVQTRIEKLRSGAMDAIILACAGLKRLGLAHEIGMPIDPDVMLPSAGQGAVGIEVHKENQDILAVFDQTRCDNTTLCVMAERAALGVLDGSCHTPIGAYATIENDIMNLKTSVASLDGKHVFFESGSINAILNFSSAHDFGAMIGRKLKSKTPAEILKQTL